MDAEDPFEDFEKVFSLEDKFYDQGYSQGFLEGARQSRIEARLFGIEKGFEKFALMGEMQAKAKIWAARFHSTRQQKAAVRQAASETSTVNPEAARTSARLDKHLEVLLALVDPSTLSFENDDDAVAEFDNRFKRAQAKARIIERMVGDGPKRPQNQTKEEGAGTARSIDNMEDFGKQ